MRRLSIRGGQFTLMNDGEHEVLPHDKRSLLEIVVESELLDEYRNKLDN